MSKPDYLLGIDILTTGAKARLVDDGTPEEVRQLWFHGRRLRQIGGWIVFRTMVDLASMSASFREADPGRPLASTL